MAAQATSSLALFAGVWALMCLLASAVVTDILMRSGTDRDA